MRTIPDSVFDEMVAVTKAVRELPGSLKYINGIRRAYLLHKKLLKIKSKTFKIMANTIRGKVFQIEKPESRTIGDRTYTSQGVIFDCTTFDRETAEPRPNFIRVVFSGRGMEEVYKITVGQRVEVSFSPRGSMYSDRNGEERNFTDLRGYKIEPLEQKQSAPRCDMAPMPSREPDDLPAQTGDDDLPY
jgi:hypothetical protein